MASSVGEGTRFHSVQTGFVFTNGHSEIRLEIGTTWDTSPTAPLRGGTTMKLTP